MLFIPNTTVDHPVAAFIFTIGVWCKQDVPDQRPPQNTAHTAYLVSLDSPLNVAPCPTILQHAHGKNGVALLTVLGGYCSCTIRKSNLLKCRGK